MNNDELIKEIENRISKYEELLDTASSSNEIITYRAKRDELVSLLSILK